MTPLQDILSQLVRLYPGLIRDEVRPYFRDVGDHATRINEIGGHDARNVDCGDGREPGAGWRGAERRVQEASPAGACCWPRR